MFITIIRVHPHLRLIIDHCELIIMNYELIIMNCELNRFMCTRYTRYGPFS